MRRHSVETGKRIQHGYPAPRMSWLAELGDFGLRLDQLESGGQENWGCPADVEPVVAKTEYQVHSLALTQRRKKVAKGLVAAAAAASKTFVPVHHHSGLVSEP